MLAYFLSTFLTYLIISTTHERGPKQAIPHLNQGLVFSTLINTSVNKRALHLGAK